MHWPNRTIFAFLLSSVALGCRTEPADPPAVVGHTLSFGGVAHASNPHHAERYCQLCHGENLVGGEGTEPSCYQCHGKNWLDDDGAYIWATSDHTESYDGYMHQPGLLAPQAHCSECHGADLRGGDGTSSPYPGCYTCHAAVWDESLD